MPDRYMDVKDYTETVSVRLTKAQVALLKAHADVLGISQSDVIRGWIESADLIPMIPLEVQKKLRQYLGRRTRQRIEDVLRQAFIRFGWWS